MYTDYRNDYIHVYVSTSKLDDTVYMIMHKDRMIEKSKQNKFEMKKLAILN